MLQSVITGSLIDVLPIPESACELPHLDLPGSSRLRTSESLCCSKSDVLTNTPDSCNFDELMRDKTVFFTWTATI